jgi:hypothetical protein
MYQSPEERELANSVDQNVENTENQVERESADQVEVADDAEKDNSAGVESSSLGE